jgi:O-antigen/teichoic acid export membrane protein
MTPGRLRRNVLLNLVGHGVPLVVAIAAIPFVTRGLGPDRFGVLALAWTFIGYFAVFDLGLGRSLTQRVAELIGEGREEDVPAVAWTGSTATFLLGVLGSASVLILADPLVRSVLRIPPELVDESLRALKVLSLSLPLVLSTNALRGLLEAYQRFGPISLVRGSVGAFMFLGPLVVLPFTARLDVIVAVIVASRAVAWAVHGWLCVHANAELARPRRPRWKGVATLFRMGGWLTVSNVISPVLMFGDRLLIGSVVSMSALAFYTTPSEVVTRVVLAPAAIAGVFFPAFAGTFRSNPERTDQLFSTAVRAALLLVFPLLLGMLVFAEPGLTLWVGPEFARDGTVVARWLVVGVLFNGLAQIPLALVHGAARADVTARLHAWEAPFYLVLLWNLVGAFGLAGAAVAWSVRAGADAALLFHAAARIVPETRRSVRAAGLWTLAAAALLAGAWGLVLRGTLWLAFLLPLAAFVAAAWKGLMRPTWRNAVVARALGRAATH